MVDILTPERLAEIAARVEARKGHYADRVKWAFADRVALLASHAALQAEVERLRAALEAVR